MWEQFLLPLQETYMFQPRCSPGHTFVFPFVVTSACRRCLSSSVVVLQSSGSGRAVCPLICFKLKCLSYHKQIEHIVCASFVDSALKQIRECSHIFTINREEEELTWKRTDHDLHGQLAQALLLPVYLAAVAW